jgi:hypothetical protein
MTVLENNPKIDLAIFNRASVILSSPPMPSIIPPNIMAQIIKIMVHIMPIIPPDENSSLSISLSVTIAVSTNMAVITVVKLDDDRELMNNEQGATFSGWLPAILAKLFVCCCWQWGSRRPAPAPLTRSLGGRGYLWQALKSGHYILTRVKRALG